jgi:phosphoserine phosphatase RsbU/P
MKKELLCMRCPAKLQSVREIRNRLNFGMQAAGVALDRQRDIALAFSEIATNVIKHGDQPASQLEMHFGNEGDYWVLEVWDDGGTFGDLSQQINNNVWSPGDDELLESGMGLALVVSSCSEHKYIPKDTSSDDWNRFIIKLSYEEKIVPEKPCIALVDDDRAITAVIKEYLSEQYKVQLFHDGKQAVDSILAQPVDLIISDIEMPNMDGFAFREHLATKQNLDLIPFIFLTGNKVEEWRDRASDMGIDDYLTKPVAKSALLQTVKRVLLRSQQLKERMGNRLDRQITQALCPTLPENLGPFNLQTRTRSASAGGGDFIFHQTTPNGELVIIGDIMGHGEEAKFFSHAYAGYLLGMMQNSTNLSGPGETLHNLSKTLLGHSILASTLITCLAVLFKPNGELIISSAGHPCPLVISSQNVQTFEVGGALPGLNPNSHYEERHLKLKTGERILFYTDGLFESAKDEKGRDHLQKMVHDRLLSSINKPINTVSDMLMALFDTPENQPLDDITFFLAQGE